MKELSLFTGMGGGIYGSLILDWQTVAYVEKDEYCQKVIKQRQQDGWFHEGEIYGDIAEFNKHHAKKYKGEIDILTGGFPCQPFSVAGKRKGTSDDRYLFDEIIKTIKIIQPRRIFFENVPGILASNAIIEIYESLTKAGYRPKAPLVIGSADCGNIHKRERVWIFADSKEFRRRRGQSEECRNERSKCQQTEQERGALRGEASRCTFRKVHNTSTPKHGTQGDQRLSRRESIGSIEDIINHPDIPEPLLWGVGDELPNWKQQINAIGNGQDPIVMATAWNILNCRS